MTMEQMWQDGYCSTWEMLTSWSVNRRDFLFGHFPTISPSFKGLLLFLILISWLQLNTLQLGLLTEGKSWGCVSSYWAAAWGRGKGEPGMVLGSAEPQAPSARSYAVMHGSCRSSLLPAQLAERSKTNKGTRQHKWIRPQKIKLAGISVFLGARESLAVVLSLRFFPACAWMPPCEKPSAFSEKHQVLTEDHTPAIFHLGGRSECCGCFEVLHWLLCMWEERDCGKQTWQSTQCEPTEQREQR